MTQNDTKMQLADHSILDLAEEFYLKGGKHLFLDEIHKYTHWSREQGE